MKDNKFIIRINNHLRSTKKSNRRVSPNTLSTDRVLQQHPYLKMNKDLKQQQLIQAFGRRITQKMKVFHLTKTSCQAVLICLGQEVPLVKYRSRY